MQPRLNQVHQTMQRLAALTGQFSSLGRRRQAHATPLDLNTVLRLMTPSLERLLGPFTSLDTALHRPGIWAAADRGQVEQVILGLVINARESLPLGGAVRLSTDQRVFEFRQNFRIGTLPPGTWAMVQVFDNGSAVDEATIRSRLEPGPHSVAYDSSLSLATIAAVVRSAGGQIVLDTPLGGGKLLAACFPAVAAPRARQPATGTAGAVLLVDGDEWCRLSGARALRRAGYGVLEAGDAETALELLADVAGSCVRVVVLDAGVVMANGTPLAARLAAQHSELDVVVAASGSEQSRFARDLTSGRLGADELVHAVRERMPASG